MEYAIVSISNHEIVGFLNEYDVYIYSYGECMTVLTLFLQLWALQCQTDSGAKKETICKHNSKQYLSFSKFKVPVNQFLSVVSV